jgi:hypothetical protein
MGKQIPVRVQQAISEPAIPHDLNARLAERHTVVKVAFACPDQHRVQAGIHVHGGGKPRLELIVHCVRQVILPGLHYLPEHP